MRRSPWLAASCLSAVLALAACSSTQDVLSIAPEQGAPAQGDAGPSVITGATRPAPPLSAAVAARTKLRFDSVVGTSVEAATPLTERLGTRAKAKGFTLAGSADPATHVLKGYFSTLNEGRDTLVVYVWDVYDPAGNRLHRINGQQKVSSGGGEGWAGVPASAMQDIADTTIEQLAAWLAGSTT